MKKILIIGATSAIATACARLWARQGAALFLVGRDAGKLEIVAADLRLRGAYEVHAWQMDVTDRARHSVMIEAATGSLGRIDITLVAHGTLPDQTACQADAVLAAREFEVNALSTISILTLLANRFEQQRAGSLAVITSVAGDRGRPSNYVYGSAKAAVSAFCEGLRARLFRHGVSVSDIRPGFVATPMTEGLSLPAVLVAQPDVVARRIVAGVEKGRDLIYVPAFWSLVMLVIRNIPRFFFKRMSL